MKHSVIEMTRAVRRRLERVVRKSREQDYARRALAVLHLWETQGNVTEAAHRVRAARSSVYRWQSLYETYGEDGIRAQARGRSDWKANEEVLSMLESLVREDPRELGYLRSRWSSQLLAMELEQKWCRGSCDDGETVAGEAALSVSTGASDDVPARPEESRAAGRDRGDVGRERPVYGSVLRRRGRRGPQSTNRVELDALRRAEHGSDSGAESEALHRRCPTCPNRSAGLDRTSPKDLGGVCGAARAASSPVSAGQADRAHRRQLRHPQESSDTALAGGEPEIRASVPAHLLPVWVNVIERLWKAMHDTVTRNHRCRSMFELCQSVARFLEVVQPFPGNGHAVAHLESAI